MTVVTNVKYEFEVKDRFSLATVSAAGGKAIVCLTGLYTLATLYDPDTGAALSQPVSLTNGKLRFMLDTAGVANQGVDIYGVAGSGHGFQLYNAKISDRVIRIDKGDLNSALVVPFSYATGTDASERDSGLDFPVGALVDPFPWADVKAIDATETIDAGILSTETGDADGFLKLVSVGVLGVTRGKHAATATYGVLIQESQDAAAVNTPIPYEVLSTGVSLSWTLTTGSDTGTGRLVFPYRLGVLG